MTPFSGSHATASLSGGKNYPGDKSHATARRIAAEFGAEKKKARLFRLAAFTLSRST
ncbi:hypothetical protein [Ammonifex degensii]|uniref:hypothetical protein n=1 Tax=Ammonifex degensii TaxID=42838 RepID=UPI00145D9182|nr:hypothetical protein [Ammonifex degensii]